MAKAGLIVTGAVLTLIAVLLLTFAFHWFQLTLLLIGLAALVGGLIPSGTDQPPAKIAPPAKPDDLGMHLRALDALLEEGTLKAAEHRRKRRELLDAWGLPPTAK